MKKITLSVILLFFSGLLFSQSINVNTTTYTVPQLVQDVLINSPCAQVSNITWRSGATTGTTNGIGYFSNTNSSFPMTEGVVMVSGTAASVAGPNNTTISGGNWSGDAQLFNYIDNFDLDPIAPGQQPLDPSLNSYNDATIIEFDFLPFTNNMSFNFLFASEEYGTFQCSFSDAFAFFLTNTVTNTTTNLALIPGTTTPIAVTTIRNALHNAGCASANSEYFGVFNGGANAATSATNLNGQTVKLTAASTVVANNLYHIKLVIADRNDNALDSAVFIEGGSFNVGVANLTYPIGLGGAYTQDMLVSNGQAICPGDTRVVSTGLDPNNFDFVWTLNGNDLNINEPSIVVNQPGTYCVNASVPGGGSCSQNDCVVVEYFTGFDINEDPGDLVICSSPVDLTVYDSVILDGQDPNIHEVQYYYSMADAHAENNPITAPIAITLGQTIPIVAKVINIFAACPEYANFNVVYAPANTVTAASTTPTLCQNTLLSPNITHITTSATGIGTATGLPNGITASWSGNSIIIEGTPTVAGTFNYTIPLTGGCGIANATGTITVLPGMSVTAASSTPTLCIDTPLALAITHNTTSATGIGTPTNLPAGVTATWSADTINISGTPTVSGVFNYTIPLTGACSINATGTITVTPNNTVTAASSTATLCLNTALVTPITHTTTGATGIGVATGLPAGITASWSSDAIQISGTPSVTGVFNYSIPLTGGCGAINATGTITVISNNTVTAASSTPTLCINTPLSITHNTTGATGIGTSTGLPAGVTASWASDMITISGTPTVSGTFTYDIPLTGGCGAFSATGTITVTPDNTVTAASITPTLCINTLMATSITHNTTGATGIGAATGLPAGVTASWAGDTITISGTPSVAGVFNYSIPLTGGCGIINATGTITVTPNNTVAAASSSPTLCINTLLSPTVTHATTGATGIGTPTGLPAGLTATLVGTSIEISGTPTVAGTFNYDIPLTGGCGAFSATGTITVNPNNTVTAATYSPTLCVNTVLTPSIFHTTTGATGIGTATGLPAGVIASWAGNTIEILGTPTATGVFNYSIPLAGGCGGVATGTITVIPNNTVTAASATPTLCVNTPLTPSITHFTTGATGIGVVTGLPTGVTASWNADAITISGTPSVTGVFNYTIPLTGGCGTINATGTITVNPDNTVSAASLNPTICINTATTITYNTTGATGIGTATGLPAGVTASWAGNVITVSGAPTVAGTFNYTIPLTGGCGTVSATGTITVIPSNTVTAGSSTTICVNSPLPVITHNTTGATGIGTATNLPVGVTATWAGDMITISGTPSTTGTFNYSIPLTGGCGTVNATGTIIVNPIPTNITISGTTTTCAGIQVNLTVTGTPGTVITWSGSATPITIGASGSNVIPVSPSVTTTYTLTSADLNGCTIAVVGQSAVVTVSATPQFITQIPDITICNGGTLNIASQLTSTVPGTTFIWSATTGNVNMAAISGNETNIDQIVTLINDLQNGTVNIEVKPQVGNCSGTSQQILVTVKPIPVITSTVVDEPVICNNEFVTITSNSNPVATMYNWQVNTATGVQIVGGATSGTSATGIVNLQLALTDPLVAGTISFDFTPVNGICTGATVTNAVTINVNPIPGTPIALPDDVICSNETTNLTISSFPNIAGTMLEWTVIDSQNVTGFTAGVNLGASPLSINDVLVNTSNVQGYVKYRVTSKLGDCEGGTTEYIVFVDPLPKPNLIDGHVCVNQTTNVTYQSYVLDTQLSDPNFTYDWFVLNTTTGLYDALPSTNGPTYEVTIPGTYQVIVTNTVTNCQSVPVNATVISVYPATDFTYVVTDAFTNNATITVTVNPIGTGNLIYSLDGGAWQSSNVFTGVEAGEHEIMVEDVEGCTNLTQTVTVIDYPKYFTPNGDGIHDTWNIIGLNQANAKLYIFDRYGKLIKQISPTDQSLGWDGTYNGQQAPSTDYWFTIDFNENNQQKQFKAHFSLKR